MAGGGSSGRTGSGERHPGGQARILPTRWPWLAGLAALLAIGGAVRLRTLERRNLWADEAISLERVRMAPGVLVSEMRGQLHPPVYFLALGQWCRLLGRADGRSMRLFSTVWSLIGIALLYGLGAALFSRPVGLAAAALMALSPHQVYFAQEARMYSLAAAEGLAATWMLVRFLRGGGRGWLAGYALTTLLAVHTHFIMWLLVLSQVVGAPAAFGWRRWRAWATAGAAAAVGLVALLWVASIHLRRARETDWAEPSSIPLSVQRVVELFKDVAGSKFVEVNQIPAMVRKYARAPHYLKWRFDQAYVGARVVVVLGTAVLVVVAAAAAARLVGGPKTAERRFTAGLFFVPLVFEAVGFLVKDLKVTRYLAPFVPYLVLTVAAAPLGRWLRAGAVAVLLAAMVNGAGVDADRDADLDDYRPVAEWFKGEYVTGEPVAAHPPYMATLLLYELGRIGGPGLATGTPAEVLSGRPAAFWFVADSRSPYWRAGAGLPEWIPAEYQAVQDQRFETWFTKTRLLRFRRREATSEPAAPPP